MTDRIGAAHALVVLALAFCCVLAYAIYDLKQKPRLPSAGEAVPTAEPDEPPAELADHIVVVPAQTMASDVVRPRRCQWAAPTRSLC